LVALSFTLILNKFHSVCGLVLNVLVSYCLQMLRFHNHLVTYLHYIWCVMKKYLLLLLVCISTLILISWGFTGHRTVALIAERHLTLQAKTAVADLLGSESIADVSTWADQVRNKPEYKNTAGWHFLNLPLGLNLTDFEKQVKSQDKESVYTALIKQQLVLKSTSSTREQRIEALKYIVHFVGDAHQPMHISRSEDKGGNTIQLQYEGKGTNLHSLWDSKLLDKQGMSDTQMSTELDKATPAQIKQWQSENILYWIYESYQISSQLYSEVKSGSKLDDTYYQKHIGTVNERIEKAAIRLAGVLNEAFKNYKPSSLQVKESISTSKETVQKAIQIATKDAGSHIGELVTIKDNVYGSRDMGSFVLVNVGAEFPNQLLTVVLRGETKALSKELNGRAISVTGKVTEFKGKPQIEVREPSQIKAELSDNILGP
jgi:hypothetical protein